MYICIMGQSNSKSTLSYNETALEIIQDIRQHAKRLSSQYTTEFLNREFCKSVSLLYSDKLLKFRKQEIDGVVYMLGIANKDEKTKRQACEIIISHYLRRFQLIAKIDRSLEHTFTVIDSIMNRNKCNGHPEIYNEDRCTASGGSWSKVSALPEDIKENKAWYQQLHNLQREYIKFIKRLKSILTQLDDFDEYVNDERLTALEREFEILSKKMNKITQEKYQTIMTTPTRTQRDIYEENLRVSANKDKMMARKEATRSMIIR